MKLFHSSTLKQRLMFVIGTLLLLSVGIAGVGTYSVRQTKGILREVQKDISDANEMTQVSLQIRDVFGLLAQTTRRYTKGTSTPQEILDKMEKELTDVDQALLKYAADGSLDGRREELHQQLLTDWDEAKAKVRTLLKDMSIGKSELSELNSIIDDVSTRIAKMDKAVEESLSLVVQAGQEGFSDAEALETQSGVMYLGALILGLLLSTLSVYFVFNISNRIARTSQKLRNVSEAIARVTAEIDHTGMNLSKMVSKQASDLNESVASMQEISAMIDASARSAKSTLEHAENANSKSRTGLETIGELENAMDGIGNAKEDLATINQIIQEIDKKTMIIHEIVFKTQLLSFNASIEAARAGQHGRGFAVVAEEIGSLSQISGQAAEEIRKLLIKSAEAASSTIVRVDERIKVAQKTSEMCTNVFTQISEGIAQLTPMVEAIQNSAKEQAIGVEETNHALQEMDNVTQANSVSARRLTEVAPDLRLQSRGLGEEVMDLNKLVFGASTGSFIGFVRSRDASRINPSRLKEMVARKLARRQSRMDNPKL